MPDIAVVVCLALDHRSPSEGLAAFKACICKCPFVDTTLEVTGSFDLIVEGRCASFEEYTCYMENLRPQLAQFVTRFEANFVGKRIDQKCPDALRGGLWLPCDGGHRQVASHFIDKVVAEGDYMRVYMSDWSSLVHSTMHGLRERLDDSQFIQLHRSTLVRIAFIDRLIHDNHRWKARLRSGEMISVAKSHVRDAIRLISGHSSKPDGSVTKSTTDVGDRGPLKETPTPTANGNTR